MKKDLISVLLENFDDFNEETQKALKKSLRSAKLVKNEMESHSVDISIRSSTETNELIKKLDEID